MTKAEKRLLIDLACYFSERAVEARDTQYVSLCEQAKLLDEVAYIIGNWGRNDAR